MGLKRIYASDDVASVHYWHDRNWWLTRHDVTRDEIVRMVDCGVFELAAKYRAKLATRQRYRLVSGTTLEAARAVATVQQAMSP